MPSETVGSALGVPLTGFAAKHPRLVVTLLLPIVLITAQGSVAAATDVDGAMVDTSGSGSVDDGP